MQMLYRSVMVKKELSAKAKPSIYIPTLRLWIQVVEISFL